MSGSPRAGDQVEAGNQGRLCTFNKLQQGCFMFLVYGPADPKITESKIKFKIFKFCSLCSFGASDVHYLLKMLNDPFLG